MADEEQSGPGLWEFAGESGSDSAKTAIVVFATSIYKQPTHILLQKTTTVSSGDIHAHLRAVIPSFGFHLGHVTRK